MDGIAQTHHDWVKDTFNVDPLVYTQPDADIEQDLDTLDLNKVQIDSVDLTQLSKDFTDPVHAAAVRAHTAFIDLEVISTIAWKPEDSKGAGAVLAKSTPEMSREDRAILAGDLKAVDLNRQLVERSANGARAAANVYQAAAKQLRAMPQQVDAPPPPPDPLGDAGAVLEHIWDFINSVSQIVDVVGAIHLVAGSDIIKDAIKQDSTDKQIAALGDQIDTQRDAINGLIKAVEGRAHDDMANAFEDYLNKIEEIQEGIRKTKDAIDAYAKDLEQFSRPAAAKGKSPGPAKAENPDLNKIMQTYKAVLEAATLSKMARKSLKTPSLGPSTYKGWASKMIPLGKPITDDTKTGGASLFRKGGLVVRYSATSAVTEALASGLEVVVSVYDEAATIDAFAADWAAAMRVAR